MDKRPLFSAAFSKVPRYVRFIFMVAECAIHSIDVQSDM